MPATIDARVEVAPARFRAYGPKGLKADGVDREKRVIRGYAVITRGEALGHGLWIDSEMVDQVVRAGNAAPKGIKSRFTHPGLCSDGLGKYLGRARNFRRDGDIARADLHFSDVTAKSPEFERDPAEYVMDLAEKDPAAFAASIVYYPDYGEEQRHIAANTDEDGEFRSPDADNERDLPHARLAELCAADLVDEPAANPGGFFSQSEEQAVVAEQFLSWILGEPNAVPPGPEAMGGGDPNRIREFFHGFLQRHGLEVNHTVKEIVMPETKVEAASAPSAEELRKEAQDAFAANLTSLREAFPKDQSFAVQCAAEGLTVEQAKAKYADLLTARLAESQAKIAELDAANAELKTKIDGINAQLLAGAAPVKPAPEAQAVSPEEQAYRKAEAEGRIRVLGAETKS